LFPGALLRGCEEDATGKSGSSPATSIMTMKPQVAVFDSKKRGTEKTRGKINPSYSLKFSACFMT